MARRCRPATSLGITRSFPRLYPPVGLVTVALLTLAPLALRPVRLACLIHAANVHSEPGSNPSKWPGESGPRGAPLDPHRSSGSRNTDWSQRGRLGEDRSPPRRPRCRSVMPPRRRTASDRGDPASPDDPTPASLKGPHRRFDRSRSTGLSKKRAIASRHRRHRPERPHPRRVSHAGRHYVETAIRSRPRPGSVVLHRAVAGRLSRRVFLTGDKGHDTGELAEVNTPAGNFRVRWLHRAMPSDPTAPEPKAPAVHRLDGRLAALLG